MIISWTAARHTKTVGIGPLTCGDKDEYLSNKNQRVNNQSEVTYIYGTRAVIEALNSGKELDKVFIQEGVKNDLFRELMRSLSQAQVPYQLVPIQKINKMAAGKNHQGVVAIYSGVAYHDVENLLPQIFERGEVPLLLILDRITDVRNFGAIARTAECSGVHAIIIPARGSALITGDAVKTSAGALHKIAVCREQNLKHTIEFLTESGLQIVGCTEKTDSLIYTPDYTLPTAIIMGSEEDGISGEYLKRCTAKVKIPMYGTVDSLNVSVSAGVVLYEAIRQRLQGQ
jgi:23S rRNA (guanosine2251-2'-O)-methyltransferase